MSRRGWVGGCVALVATVVGCGARTGLNGPTDASAEDVVVTVDVVDVPPPPPTPDVPAPIDVPLPPPPPDAGMEPGYRREVNPPGLAYIDACAIPGRTSLLPNVDDSRAEFRLPFAFRYWSIERAAGSAINVTTNGWVGLDDGTNLNLVGTIPNPDRPNAVVAPYWRDTITLSFGVCIATVGTAPNRRTILDWHQVRDLGTGNQLSFNVVLHETSNVIELAYGTMVDPLEATVGMENHSGSRGLGGCPDGATQCTPRSNTSVRFVPVN